MALNPETLTRVDPLSAQIQTRSSGPGCKAELNGPSIKGMRIAYKLSSWRWKRIYWVSGWILEALDPTHIDDIQILNLKMLKKGMLVKWPSGFLRRWAGLG